MDNSVFQKLEGGEDMEVVQDDLKKQVSVLWYDPNVMTIQIDRTPYRCDVLHSEKNTFHSSAIPSTFRKDREEESTLKCFDTSEKDTNLNSLIPHSAIRHDPVIKTSLENPSGSKVLEMREKFNMKTNTLISRPLEKNYSSPIPNILRKERKEESTLKSFDTSEKDTNLKSLIPYSAIRHDPVIKTSLENPSDSKVLEMREKFDMKTNTLISRPLERNYSSPIPSTLRQEREEESTSKSFDTSEQDTNLKSLIPHSAIRHDPVIKTSLDNPSDSKVLEMREKFNMKINTLISRPLERNYASAIPSTLRKEREEESTSKSFDASEKDTNLKRLIPHSAIRHDPVIKTSLENPSGSKVLGMREEFNMKTNSHPLERIGIKPIVYLKHAHIKEIPCPLDSKNGVPKGNILFKGNKSLGNDFKSIVNLEQVKKKKICLIKKPLDKVPRVTSSAPYCLNYTVSKSVLNLAEVKSNTVDKNTNSLDSEFPFDSQPGTSKSLDMTVKLDTEKNNPIPCSLENQSKSLQNREKIYQISYISKPSDSQRKKIKPHSYTFDAKLNTVKSNRINCASEKGIFKSLEYSKKTDTLKPSDRQYKSQLTLDSLYDILEKEVLKSLENPKNTETSKPFDSQCKKIPPHSNTIDVKLNREKHIPISYPSKKDIFKSSENSKNTEASKPSDSQSKKTKLDSFDIDVKLDAEKSDPISCLSEKALFRSSENPKTAEIPKLFDSQCKKILPHSYNIDTKMDQEKHNPNSCPLEKDIFKSLVNLENTDTIKPFEDQGKFMTPNTFLIDAKQAPEKNIPVLCPSEKDIPKSLINPENTATSKPDSQYEKMIPSSFSIDVTLDKQTNTLIPCSTGSLQGAGSSKSLVNQQDNDKNKSQESQEKPRILCSTNDISAETFENFENFFNLYALLNKNIDEEYGESPYDIKDEPLDIDENFRNQINEDVNSIRHEIPESIINLKTEEEEEIKDEIKEEEYVDETVGDQDSKNCTDAETDLLLTVSKVQELKSTSCNPGNEQYHYCTKCSFKCDLLDCGFITKSKEIFRTHQKYVTHKKPLVQKSITNESTNLKLYRCQYCPFKSKRIISYRNHIKDCEAGIADNFKVFTNCNNCGFPMGKSQKNCKKCGWRSAELSASCKELTVKERKKFLTERHGRRGYYVIDEDSSEEDSKPETPKKIGSPRKKINLKKLRESDGEPESHKEDEDSSKEDSQPKRPTTRINHKKFQESDGKPESHKENEDSFKEDSKPDTPKRAGRPRKKITHKKLRESDSEPEPHKEDEDSSKEDSQPKMPKKMGRPTTRINLKKWQESDGKPESHKEDEDSSKEDSKSEKSKNAGQKKINLKKLQEPDGEAELYKEDKDSSKEDSQPKMPKKMGRPTTRINLKKLQESDGKPKSHKEEEDSFKEDSKSEIPKKAGRPRKNINLKKLQESDGKPEPHKEDEDSSKEDSQPEMPKKMGRATTRVNRKKLQESDGKSEPHKEDEDSSKADPQPEMPKKMGRPTTKVNRKKLQESDGEPESHKEDEDNSKEDSKPETPKQGGRTRKKINLKELRESDGEPEPHKDDEGSSKEDSQPEMPKKMGRPTTRNNRKKFQESDGEPESHKEDEDSSKEDSQPEMPKKMGRPTTRVNRKKLQESDGEPESHKEDEDSFKEDSKRETPKQGGRTRKKINLKELRESDGEPEPHKDEEDSSKEDSKPEMSKKVGRPRKKINLKQLRELDGEPELHKEDKDSSKEQSQPKMSKKMGRPTTRINLKKLQESDGVPESQKEYDDSSKEDSKPEMPKKAGRPRKKINLKRLRESDGEPEPHKEDEKSSKEDSQPKMLKKMGRPTTRINLNKLQESDVEPESYKEDEDSFKEDSKPETPKQAGRPRKKINLKRLRELDGEPEPHKEDEDSSKEDSNSEMPKNAGRPRKKINLNKLQKSNGEPESHKEDKGSFKEDSKSEMPKNAGRPRKKINLNKLQESNGEPESHKEDEDSFKEDLKSEMPKNTGRPRKKINLNKLQESNVEPESHKEDEDSFKEDSKSEMPKNADKPRKKINLKKLQESDGEPEFHKKDEDSFKEDSNSEMPKNAGRPRKKINLNKLQESNGEPESHKEDKGSFKEDSKSEMPKNAGRPRKKINLNKLQESNGEPESHKEDEDSFKEDSNSEMPKNAGRPRKKINLNKLQESNGEPESHKEDKGSFKEDSKSEMPKNAGRPRKKINLNKLQESNGEPESHKEDEDSFKEDLKSEMPKNAGRPRKKINLNKLQESNVEPESHKEDEDSFKEDLKSEMPKNAGRPRKKINLNKLQESNVEPESHKEDEDSFKEDLKLKLPKDAGRPRKKITLKRLRESDGELESRKEDEDSFKEDSKPEMPKKASRPRKKTNLEKLLESDSQPEPHKKDEDSSEEDTKPLIYRVLGTTKKNINEFQESKDEPEPRVLRSKDAKKLTANESETPKRKKNVAESGKFKPRHVKTKELADNVKNLKTKNNKAKFKNKAYRFRSSKFFWSKDNSYTRWLHPSGRPMKKFNISHLKMKTNIEKLKNIDKIDKKSENLNVNKKEKGNPETLENDSDEENMKEYDLTLKTEATVGEENNDKNNQIKKSVDVSFKIVGAKKDKESSGSRKCDDKIDNELKKNKEIDLHLETKAAIEKTQDNVENDKNSGSLYLYNKSGAKTFDNGKCDDLEKNEESDLKTKANFGNKQNNAKNSKSLDFKRFDASIETNDNLELDSVEEQNWASQDNVSDTDEYSNDYSSSDSEDWDSECLQHMINNSQYWKVTLEEIDENLFGVNMNASNHNSRSETPMEFVDSLPEWSKKEEDVVYWPTSQGIPVLNDFESTSTVLRSRPKAAPIIAVKSLNIENSAKCSKNLKKSIPPPFMAHLVERKVRMTREERLKASEAHLAQHENKLETMSISSKDSQPNELETTLTESVQIDEIPKLVEEESITNQEASKARKNSMTDHSAETKQEENNSITDKGIKRKNSLSDESMHKRKKRKKLTPFLKNLKCEFCGYRTSKKKTLAMHVLKRCKGLLIVANNEKKDVLDDDYITETENNEKEPGSDVESSQCTLLGKMIVRPPCKQKKRRNVNSSTTKDLDDGLIACSFCKVGFRDIERLTRHLRYDCKMYKWYINDKTIYIHSSISYETEWNCKYCTFSASARLTLMEHLKLECPNFRRVCCPDKKTSKCNFCDAQTKHPSDLIKHLVYGKCMNVPLHKCNYCLYAGRNPKSLVRHMVQSCKTFLRACKRFLTDTRGEDLDGLPICLYCGTMTCEDVMKKHIKYCKPKEAPIIIDSSQKDKKERFTCRCRNCGIVTYEDVMKKHIIYCRPKTLDVTKSSQNDINHYQKATTKCRFCNYSNSRVETLVQHALEECELTKAAARMYGKTKKRKPLQKEPFACDVEDCPYVGISLQEKERHMFYTEHRFFCRYCPFVTSNEFNSKSHTWRHENSEQCKYCDFKAKTLSEYHDHFTVHGQKGFFQCSTRGCRFSTYIYNRLVEHKRACSFDKFCPNCTFKTNDVNLFIIHQTHCCKLVLDIDNQIQSEDSNDKDQWLSCSFCDFKECSVTKLVGHYNSVHDILKILVYKCRACFFQVNNVFEFNKHECVRTDSKTFECPICFFSCKNLAYYQCHYLKHFNK